MAGMVRRHVNTRGHFIQSRGVEMTVGFIVAIIGMILIWDAFDGRDKKLPWPLGGLAPW